ncbi:MAG: acyltransferase, partial [Acidobacteriales bacterium]|nr:acyltransferase [Terriglobales bacterium]
FLAYPPLEKTESIAEFYWLCKTQLYYKLFFGAIGQSSKLLAPLRLKNVQHIYVGNNVLINRYAFLLTVALPGRMPPRLEIGDGCVIGHMNHISSANEVRIGAKVLTADRVHISDNSHCFADPDKAVLDQEIESRGKVSIGEGSWIGENASVLSCSVGKQCVIGANAVVIHDIPDYCVAVGSPARVVRKFDPQSGKWDRTVNQPLSDTVSG